MRGARPPARVPAALGFVLAVVWASVGAGPALAGGGFTPTALPVNTQENVTINDVACWSPGYCVAVGQEHVNNTSQSRQVLVQQTAGTWNQVSGSSITPVGGSPYGHLDSVSCPDAGSCVAVGRNGGDNSGSTGLVVTLDDGSWTAQTAPLVNDEYQVWLSEVSCASSTSCAAVGYTSSTQGAIRGLLETYDGDSWSASQVATPPVPGGVTVTETRLWGVSCSAADSCVAVGRTYSNSDGYLRGLVAELDGGTWTSANAPEPGNAFPNTSELRSVACGPEGRCVAAGEYGDLPVGNANDELLTRAPDGGWTAATAPRPAGSVQVNLGGASCASDGTCAVAGNSLDNTNEQTPVVFTASGSGWAALPVNLPANELGPEFSEVTSLYAISCVTSTYCAASGSYATTEHPGYAGLLVAVDPELGTTSSEEAPLPGDAATDYQDVPLGAVTCVDATTCTAVGSYVVGTDAQHSVGLALTVGAVTPPPPVGPSVTSISPDHGTRKGGTKVTVAGSGFKGGHVKVLFGDQKGTGVTVLSRTRLTVRTPAHAKGVVPVRVRTDAGTSEKSKKARYDYR